MDSLPGELIAHLCLFLTQASLKSFRLCSKYFASVGEEYLFQNFEFRLYPNHHRLYQLEQLSANSAIASRLKCLSFESGVPLEYADYRYWQAQIYHELSSNWSRGLAARGAFNDAYEEFHAELQARFTPDMPQRYARYRWHLDQERALVAESRIRNVLMRSMNALHKHNPTIQFKIVMAEPQITLELLEAFQDSQFAYDGPETADPRRKVANRRQHCLNHFVNFLHAALLSNYEVEELVAVDLPHQLLTVDQFSDSNVLEKFFRGLKKVDIKISSLPHSDWLSRHGLRELYFGGRNLAARRLSMLFNQTSDLETLRLELPAGNEAEYSFELFDRTNIDRFPKLWLPHLKVLALCKFRCSWDDLRALLNDAKNLESLAMSNCRLETGSMIDLLHFLPDMYLKKICIEGVWYVDEDSGEWHSHTANEFTNCFASTSYDGPYLHRGLRFKVEQFMLLGGENCPLPKCTATGHEKDDWEMLGDTSWHYLPGLPRD